MDFFCGIEKENKTKVICSTMNGGPGNQKLVLQTQVGKGIRIFGSRDHCLCVCVRCKKKCPFQRQGGLPIFLGRGGVFTRWSDNTGKAGQGGSG